MLPDRLPVKPCVLIYVLPHPGCEHKIQEVKAGMEEEGIPCSVVHSNEADVVALAYQGACNSKLGVGLGIGFNGLCIHYGKLPEKQPLFALNVTGTPADWRHFGYNAARLVKGIPFKNQSLENPVAQREGDSDLYRLVYSIVTRILQETAQGHGEVNTWSKMR